MAKILVIDDQVIIRRTMKYHLEKHGHDTFVAESGKEGLDIYQKEKPDIAIVDVMMPGMDGIEVLTRLKDASKYVEVIIASGEESIDGAIQALRQGAFDYFEKPVNFDKLGISITNALKKQETQRLLDQYVVKLKTVVAEKAREINLRKEANKKIKHLASFPEQSFNPIIEVDTTGAIVYNNTAATNVLKKLGIKEDIKLFLPEDITEIIKSFLEKKDDDQLYREVEIEGLTFGAYVHLVHELNVIRIYVRDITDHKQAAEQIHKLFTAVEQSPSAVLISDTGGKIEYVNPKFTNITGYTTRDVIGKTPNILKSGHQSHNVYKRMWNTIAADVEWHGELRNKKKSGELYWVSSSISALKNTKGLITNYINVSEDITRRKLAEVELIETRDKAEKINEELQIEIAKRKELEQNAKLAAVGKLAAGIAHEINNPLAFVYANLENLKTKFSLKIRSLIDSYDELDMPDKTRKAIEAKKEEINYTYLKTRITGMIEKSIDGAGRMKKIVMDMKTFSRVDRAEVEEVNINESIETTLGILVHEYKGRIEIKKEYDEQLPSVKCFISKLNQVFLNILANACQAIDGKGVICIRTGRDDGNIVIEIEDNGDGIPDDVKGKIFDPFFTTKPVGQGTGMGLSICHDIIQQHNGDLSVNGKKGEGTTFTIKIPISSK